MVDFRDLFMDGYIGWPGKVHDAHVFVNSFISERKEWYSIAQLEEEHQQSGHMLHCNAMVATIDPHSFKYLLI